MDSSRGFCRLTSDASPAHLPVAAHGRNRAIGLVDRPHELLCDELADVRAVGLDVAILRREVARLAYTVVEVLEEIILECSCLIVPSQFGIVEMEIK